MKISFSEVVCHRRRGSVEYALGLYLACGGRESYLSPRFLNNLALAGGLAYKSNEFIVNKSLLLDMDTIIGTKKRTTRIAKIGLTKRRNNYFTKRIARTAARIGFNNASKETLAVMGYNVIAQDGWVVKKYSDGLIEKIKPIQTATVSSLVLD